MIEMGVMQPRLPTSLTEAVILIGLDRLIHSAQILHRGGAGSAGPVARRALAGGNAHVPYLASQYLLLDGINT
ncbi:hypothetical protein MPC4_60031 [Methylocella tundrae]|uniref:Uncharacterized protein n=1 Tax=Methylocella tundrae TaxID=227605 RepID=A0A4U8Z6E4_METTU|nr:hypothetical protein [Methylocella tundrae]WPP03042.1 hypothetical protein SIN04_01390 [Methylocella tundrae]VFU16259.1 protein of unknown function [Methylocella tundrae]VTZ51942.1 hypothetical protein MPC4_60031 [Methylocella tundrae]